MPGFNARLCGDQFNGTTPPTTVQNIWKSVGGWFTVNANPVLLELQYGSLGADYWTDEQELGAGANGELPKNCRGIRFRNATPGAQALISCQIAEGDEPFLVLSSFGTVAVSGTTLIPPVDIGAALGWQDAVANAASLAVRNTLSSNTLSEYLQANQILDKASAPVGVIEKQALLLQARCDVGTGAGFPANYTIAGALHAQAWINSGVTTGLAQAGTFEAIHVDGTSDGLLFALEATVENKGAVVNSPDLSTSKVNYWGASSGTAAATAFLAMANNTGGWQLGLALRHVNSIFVRMLNPDTAGAVGIDMPNDANWGEAIRLPNAVALRGWNAAGSARHNLAVLSASDQVVLGSTTAPGGTFIQGGGAGGASFISILTAGLSIATTAAQKLGFYGVTPIVQAQLSTGVGHTVDDVITALQNLGLVHQ